MVKILKENKLIAVRELNWKIIDLKSSRFCLIIFKTSWRQYTLLITVPNNTIELLKNNINILSKILGIKGKCGKKSSSTLQL